MKTKTHIYVATVLVLMLIASAAMAIFWLPGVLLYVSTFLSGGTFVIFQILCGIIAVVLFGILVSAMAFPGAIVEDAIFTMKTANHIKWLSVALFIDSLLLCGVSVWVIAAGERILMPALFFVSLIGVMAALAIYILSGYIARAAELKEEADLTL